MEALAEANFVSQRPSFLPASVFCTDGDTMDSAFTIKIDVTSNRHLGDKSWNCRCLRL